MKVFRVEHSETKQGPYNMGPAWQDDFNKHTDWDHDGWYWSGCNITMRIRNRFDLLGIPGWDMYHDSFYSCLLKEEDISFWFSDTELVKLFNLGFHIYTYDVDESYVVLGDNQQAAFIRSKASNREVWL